MASNTGKKQEKKKKRKPGTFVKGDPRINRKGRPKSFDQLRTLAQAIAHEKAVVGGDTVVINGHTVTVAEMIMRKWALSKDPKLQKAFIEVAFGKVPDEVKVGGQGSDAIRLEVTFVDGDAKFIGG